MLRVIPLIGNSVLYMFLFMLLGHPSSWWMAPFGAVSLALLVLSITYCCGQFVEAFRSGEVDIVRVVIDGLRPWLRVLKLTRSEIGDGGSGPFYRLPFRTH